MAMAELGICRTCNGPVSNEAVVCPHCGQPSPFIPAIADEGEVVAFLLRGEIIQAIKRVKERTGWSLQEAHGYVHQIKQAKNL
jgi:ribosomal protein L7/L12